jgi:hypothetical protein
MSEVFSENIRVQMEKYVESLKSDNPLWSSEDILAAVVGKEKWDVPSHFVRGPPLVELDDADRCGARVWSGWNEAKGEMKCGWGSRCAKPSAGGGEYCMTCKKKADVTREACQFWEEGDELPKGAKVGKAKGLFYGSWGGEYPILGKNGKTIAIVWKNPAAVTRTIALMEGGATYHPYTKEGKAGKTTPPRLAANKKSGKKGKKGVGPRRERPKGAFDYWRKVNGSVVRTAIKEMFARTGKFPNRTLSLLCEHSLNVDAAFAAYGGISAEDWELFCDENPLPARYSGDADKLGNFTGKLTNGMILGTTSKLCHDVWRKLSAPRGEEESDDEFAARKSATQPYEEAEKEAKSAAPVVAEKAKKAKKAKKTKTPAPTPPSSEDEEDEEDEAHEYELLDGTTVYVDSEWNAYNEEAEELGVVDPKTKTLTAKE